MNGPNTSIEHARRRARQAGFTMMEVMLALTVFVIGLVGLVATQSRGIEAHQASMQMREAERVAQFVMNDLQSRGFDELASLRFDGNPQFPPYADSSGATGSRLVMDYNAVPVEDPTAVLRPGSRERFFAVYRSVQPVPPAATTADQLDGLALTVQVLWLDTTNAALPPPASVTVDSLQPNMVDPTNVADYRDYVRVVELRTVRLNDNGSLQGTVGNP